MGVAVFGWYLSRTLLSILPTRPKVRRYESHFIVYEGLEHQEDGSLKYISQTLLLKAISKTVLEQHKSVLSFLCDQSTL